VKQLFKNSAILFIASFFVVLFFYPQVRSLNTVFFAKGGDGFSSYYGALYHVKYDSNYWHFEGMQYPYGESLFFTGAQPLISNNIKRLAKQGWDLTDKTVAIINGAMLLALVLGVFFLYLLLIELGVPWWGSVVFSLLIGFLSPQMDRLLGHFPLAWLVWIPAYAYGFVRSLRKPSWQLSLFLGLFLLLGALMHMYFLGMYFFFFALYWFVTWQSEKRNFPKCSWLHLLLQFVIPFILLLLMQSMASDVNDRTGFPWGYLFYRSRPEAVFLPLHKPYGAFLHHFINVNRIQWEGIAYIGAVALVFVIVRTVQALLKYYHNRRFMALLPGNYNFRVQYLLWVGIAGLLYAFGLPFVLGLEWLVPYLGPLKQMRGIARFAWLFYYTINISMVCWLFQHKWAKPRNKIIILLVVVAVMGYDAWHCVKTKSPFMQHTESLLAKEQWKAYCEANFPEISFINYQCVMPLPYTHVGSENYWKTGGESSLFYSFILSLNEGMATNAVHMSRTSLSQSFAAIDLVMEPQGKLPVLADYIPDKPLLLLVAKADEEKLLLNELNLLRFAKPLGVSPDFALYEIWPADMQKRIDEASVEALEQVAENIDYGYVFDDYNQLSTPGFIGNGLTLGLKNEQVLYAGMPSWLNPGDTLVTAFWLGQLTSDLHPRSRVKLRMFVNGKQVRYLSDDAWRMLKAIEGDWGLIERTEVVPEGVDSLSLTIKNDLLIRGHLLVDELLIRKAGSYIVRDKDSLLQVNNRCYYLDNPVQNDK